MTIIGLGPLMIVAFQGYHCARQGVIDSQKEHLRTVLQSRKSNLVRWFDQRKKEIHILTLIPQLCEMCSGNSSKPMLDQSHCDLVNFVRESDVAYKYIALFDPDWNSIQNASHEDGQSAIPPVPDEIKSDLSREPGEVKTFVKVSPTQEIELLIVKSFISDRKERQGFIIASLNLTITLKPLLEDRTGLGKTGKVYLLSSDGRYQCPSTGFGKIVGQKAEIPPEIISGNTQKVLEYRDFRHQKVLGVSSSVPDLSWTVVAEIDRAEAFSWIHTLKNRAMITALITMIVVVVVSMKIAFHLSQPLRQLASVAKTIARGNHEMRVAEMEGVEAQDVAEAFNSMMDKIESTHNRLVQTSSLAAMGEISSSIVHEMRNPLSTVKLNLQALRKKVEDDPKFSELANLALGQVGRLEKLFSDLLSYSKPIELHPSPLLFTPLAGEVIEILKSEWEARRISIRISDQAGEKPFWADREQILRGLTNILSNAIQASSNGGEIVLSAKNPPDKPDKIAISVLDHGEGLDERKMSRLFQSFFSTRENGTGLGLANVRKIVEYHQGTVSAENRTEGGAVFTIFLPLKGSES
jgi:signal transduction histidine kinase